MTQSATAPPGSECWTRSEWDAFLMGVFPGALKARAPAVGMTPLPYRDATAVREKALDAALAAFRGHSVPVDDLLKAARQIEGYLNGIGPIGGSNPGTFADDLRGAAAQLGGNLGQIAREAAQTQRTQ